MRNLTKKLTLNRETVRSLHVKSALRTGADSGRSASCAPPATGFCDSNFPPCHSIGHSLNANCAGDTQLKQVADIGDVNLAPGG